MWEGAVIGRLRGEVSGRRLGGVRVKKGKDRREEQSGVPAIQLAGSARYRSSAVILSFLFRKVPLLGALPPGPMQRCPNLSTEEA